MRYLYALFLVVFLIPAQPAQAASPGYLKDKLVIISGDENTQHEFQVELALSQEQHRRGLMHRTKLDDNQGMFFWFGIPEERSFWMKNTLIPLDVLFIDEQGVIFSIHSNTIPFDLRPLYSHGKAIAALEIRGGRTGELGIKVGDRIKQRLLDNNIQQ